MVEVEKIDGYDPATAIRTEALIRTVKQEL